jgi:predicted dinucleotide-binding enzyme
MDVTIIGTGNMARGIGSRLLAGGHDVTVVGKEAEAAEAVAAELRSSADGGSIETATSSDPLGGEVVVLAVYYPDARDAVQHYGEQLEGRVVVDITNPVNETYDALVVPPDSSATAELAQLAPDGAKLVKAFNTIFGRTLVAGEVAGQPLDVFIAGDDDGARGTVAQLAEDGGLRAVDAGGQDRARELEAAGLLHMSVQGALGTGFGSALKVLA